MNDDQFKTTQEFWRLWDDKFSSRSSLSSVVPRFETVREGVATGTHIVPAVALRLGFEMSLADSSPWLVPYVSGVCHEILLHDARPFELLCAVFEGNFPTAQNRDEVLELASICDTIWWTALSRAYINPNTSQLPERDCDRKNLLYLDVLAQICSQSVLPLPERLSGDDLIVQQTELARLAAHFELDLKHICPDFKYGACPSISLSMARSDLTNVHPCSWEVKDLVNHLLERTNVAPELILKTLFRSGGLGAAITALPLRECICEALEKGPDSCAETLSLAPLVHILFQLFGFAMRGKRVLFSSGVQVLTGDIESITSMLSCPEVASRWQADCQRDLGALVRRSTTE